MTAITSGNKELSKNAFFGGSALILTVVLTSLLAIVGVLFLMTSRIERMATSAVSESFELDLAVDTVVGRISEHLIWDVPGTNVPGWGFPEYHDYPGPEDRWLAASEPNNVGTWSQISDVTGILAFSGRRTRNILIAKVPDDSLIVLQVDGLPDQLADADGDGIADSKWVPINGITSSKGEPIYAAIRITDNCGKINVNTAFKFDPCDPVVLDPADPNMSGIDGRSVLQINLMALSHRPSKVPTPTEKAKAQRDLLLERADPNFIAAPYDLTRYENSVIWQYGELPLPYTPFDISDELELRNRFLLNQRDTDVRIERFGWARSFCDDGFAGTTLEVPASSAHGTTVANWLDHARLFAPDIARWKFYDYRHIATTYSMDRIINPAGPWFSNGRMVNVNTANRTLLRDTIREALLNYRRDFGPLTVVEVADADRRAAQIAANLVDYRDADSDVTVVREPNGAPHYGFERPCIYISEVAAIVELIVGVPRACYAVELHKPYFEDGPPSSRSINWRLEIGGSTVPIDWSGTRRFHVVLLDDPGLAGASLFTTNALVTFNDANEPNDADTRRIFGYAKGAPSVQDDNSGVDIKEDGTTTINLQRPVPGGGFITVDSFIVPALSTVSGWLEVGEGAHTIQRDITRHKCIRRLWDTVDAADPNTTLGRLNAFVDPDPRVVQAHPHLDPDVYDYSGSYGGFKNIGEIGKVFGVSGYDVPDGSTPAELLLDFQNRLLARILNYLTVFDPRDHGHSSNETRIKGRININTAPPFVIEQLPWLASLPEGAAIARRVVAVRDGGLKGFRSIGELTLAAGVPGTAPVYGMDFYTFDGADQSGFPDLTPLKLRKVLEKKPIDDATDDFEERDLIFHRISNLITVRSDVFTAYILVRIGADGPQKRVIAILDRSDVRPIKGAPYITGKVKVRALHQVPDPW